MQIFGPGAGHLKQHRCDPGAIGEEKINDRLDIKLQLQMTQRVFL